MELAQLIPWEEFEEKYAEHCAEQQRDLQISGPPRGRPPKDPSKYRRLLKGAKEFEIERIPIEGVFGNGKRKYGWSRISSKLKNTSEPASH